MKTQKVNVIVIPPDDHIEIKIGGMFYQRLNKLFIEYGDSVPKSKLLFAVDLIKRDKAVKDDFAYNFETLMVLIRDIEKAFKDAGKTKEQEMELELPDDTVTNQS